jgi:hypothetical protein
MVEMPPESPLNQKGTGKTIGILQPGYLPWLGFFEQLSVSDIFIIYDDVQYDKHGWRNRNRIKTVSGVQWLTVPVLVNYSQRPLITDIRISDRDNWPKKHFLSIKQNYSKAPFFQTYIDLFAAAYKRNWEYLIDLDMYFIFELSKCLGIPTEKIVRSSALEVSGGKITRLLTLCKLFEADFFYEGASGKNYLDEAEFQEAGITISYQEYNHPIYNQLYGEFIPNLSIIDLLFNHGPESLAILNHKDKKANSWSARE